MPSVPVPADPGWDDDLTWLDRDPATPAERAEWLDRVAEADDPPEEEEYEDFDLFTPEELAEVREAAADDLLAVKAATTGRRGPGQPGSARIFPGETSSRAAAFGPGMALDVLPGGAQLAVAADAAAGDDGSAGVSEAEPGCPGPRRPVVAAWTASRSSAAAWRTSASSSGVSGSKSSHSSSSGGSSCSHTRSSHSSRSAAVTGSRSSQARSSSRPGSAGTGSAGMNHIRSE